MKLVMATRNAHKLQEIHDIFDFTTSRLFSPLLPGCAGRAPTFNYRPYLLHIFYHAINLLRN